MRVAPRKTMRSRLRGCGRATLNTASAYLDLGRELAKLVYGHEINYVLLMHLGAFSSTILPDALDLLQKKGFKLVTLEEAESDPAYATIRMWDR